MDRKSAPSFVPTPLSAGSNTTAAASSSGNAAGAGHVGSPRVVVVYHHEGEQAYRDGMHAYASTGYEGLSAAEHGRLGGNDINIAMAAFAPGNNHNVVPGHPYQQASFFPGGVRGMGPGTPMIYPYHASFVPSGVSYVAAGYGMGYPHQLVYPPFAPRGVLPDPMTGAINPAAGHPDGSFATVQQAGSYNDWSTNAAAHYHASTSASTGQELPPHHSFDAMPRPGHRWPLAANAVPHPSWAASNAADIYGAGSSSTTADIYGAGSSSTTADIYGAASSSTTADGGRRRYNLQGNVDLSNLATGHHRGHASPTGTGDGGSLHSSDDSFLAGVLDLAIEPNKTRLCCTWLNFNGQCPLGNRCKFAHGENQQWSSPADVARKNEAVKSGRYKTVPCRLWIQYGSCVYGKNCTYAHGPSDHGSDKLN